MRVIFGLLLLIFASGVLANESSCGSDPTKVKDCENNDLGSCGNACCAIDCFMRPIDFDEAQVRQTMEAFLKSGGPDGSFTLSDKPDAAGHDPSDDLRQYNLTQKFIFQGTHTTTGGYVDTLNFVVSRHEESKQVVIRAFSISNIHGALGDGGQNFKTLKYLSDSLGKQTDGDICEDIQIVHGCGKSK